MRVFALARAIGWPSVQETCNARGRRWNFLMTNKIMMLLFVDSP